MADDTDPGDESPSERTAIRRRSVQSREPEPRGFARWCSSRRYFVAFMAFLGFCNIYALRVNLSVAIVSMTTNKTIHWSNGSTTIEPAEFDWSPEIQGVILSSFFYGYILTQIPGGYLAAAYGGKRLFGVCIAIESCLALFLPILARTSIYCLVGIRVFEGLLQGVAYPAMHSIWSKWAPPLERSKLATAAFSGSYFGTVVALPLSGFLADNFGWPSIFDIFGVIACVWALLWLKLVAESPQTDPHISEDELNYIRSSVGSQASHVKNMPVPWKRMLMSFPVWAIIIAHFSENWGFYTLLTELPTFMNDVHGYDLHKAALLAALPYLAMGIVVQLGGFMADWLRANGSLTTVKVRKIFNCGGFLFQTVFLLIAAHTSSITLFMICLTAAVGFGGFAWSGFGVNHLDIAPMYASILMGLSNTFATLPGMISPVITGHLVQHKTPEEWVAVFYIASGVYLVGAIFYGIFASGEEQSWSQTGTGLLRDAESSNTEDMPFGEATCE